jgi:hypothetical protein
MPAPNVNVKASYGCSEGRAFVSTSGVLSLSVATDQYLLYFKAGTQRCRVTRVNFSTGPGVVATVGGTLYLSATPTGTITGTDLAKVNRFIGKGQTATATVKGTLSGVTGKGDPLHSVPFNVNKQVDLSFPDGILLNPGAALLVSADVEGATLKVGVTIEWTEETVD